MDLSPGASELLIGLLALLGVPAVMFGLLAVVAAAAAALERTGQ